MSANRIQLLVNPVNKYDPTNRTDPTGLFDLDSIVRSVGIPNDRIAISDKFRGKFGWLQLLLDAQPGDTVIIGGATAAGNSPLARFATISCQDTGFSPRIAIDGMAPDQFLADLGRWPEPDSIRSWYSLNGYGPFTLPRFQLSENGFGAGDFIRGIYSDYHDTQILPDYVVAVSGGLSGWTPIGNLSVSELIIIDRFGNVYFSVQVGATTPNPVVTPNFMVTTLGGGYIGQWGSPNALNEQDLKASISGISLYADVSFGLGDFGVSAGLGWWGYYLSWGTSFPSISAGVQVTFTPGDVKIEELGWHRLEQGINGADLKYGPASQVSCGCK